MKHYNLYMDRQEISPAAHEKLLHLEVRKQSGRPWARYGALAACAVLLVGAGVWRLAPASSPAPHTSSAGQFAASYTPLPGEKDVVEPDGLFVVNSPAEDGKLMFPMIPSILYQDITDQPETDAARAYAPGSFTADLTREDIQTIFWGPEGKPRSDHPKTEQGDLPWMLFWDGYTLHGRAWYSGEGKLTELTIWGEKSQADFTLELCVGSLPFTCCIDRDRGDTVSDAFGVEVAGWSKRYDRDGGEIYICGSEFMTESGIGVRFVNQNSTIRAEYGEEDDNMDLGGARTFNTLFVRQALISDGGLYLDHLMTNNNIPPWREEEFSTLAQARQEETFAPYLPTEELSGYGEFYGRLSYQEGTQNTLFVRWSRGYDDVEVAVYQDGYRSYDLADPDNPASYDVRLYEIPWYDSVPEAYRETVNCPAFRAEDMSLSLVEARGHEKDTGGLNFCFEVLHPDGTLVGYHCDGLTARQVWELVEETLAG